MKTTTATLTVALTLAVASTTTAFTPPSLSAATRPSLLVRSASVIGDAPRVVPNVEPENDKPRRLLNKKGIATSGLKGMALDFVDEAYPKANQLRSVIPKDCFEPETSKSLGYLSVSLVGTALCTAAGVALLGVANPASLVTLPLWTAYSVVTGTVAMGLWVLAHECGHGAFSKNKALQDAIGYTIHSLMLVPYYSWQRSHAVHHQYTNHIELGETHVPELVRDAAAPDGAMAVRTKVINVMGAKNGLRAWGVLQLFLHLVTGWPAYLLVGATGGVDRGMTNHYYPNPLTTPNQPNKELFPGNWKDKVLKSDLGIAAVLGTAALWAAFRGVPEVMALYGGPLLVVNAWLVTYTWLQHTDVDVPHFSSDNHSFVKGALHTIDRPYEKMDPLGAIDFLHHKIGSTHVVHHFDSTIPHYKADVATKAFKENFPEHYLHDPTPIPQALWRVARGCAATEKRDGRWVFNNEGLEHLL
jgi:fatty acid desaturase